MSKRSIKILSAFTALIISGCTQLGLGLANLPANLSNAKIKEDISYGSKDWQKLDIYIPGNPQKSKLPVITFFYGGRWSEGSKDLYRFIGKAFNDKGYIVVIADYSKYPSVKFPVFVNDAAAAIAWTYRNIDQYGGDNKNIFVSGHSSGAHIGALALADTRYLKEFDLTPDIVTAFAGIAGPYDFVPQAEDLKDMFGPPEQYPQMQVTSFIDGSEPPMLLLWGEKDTAVAERNHKLLSEKIREQDGDVEVKTYKDINHVEIVAALTWFWPYKTPVYQDILSFFEKHKKKEEKS